MSVTFFRISRVLFSLTVEISYSIYLTSSLLIIKSKGTTNSSTLHLLSSVITWTGVSRGNSLAPAKLSHTSYIHYVRSKTLSFGTLVIPSLEILLMKSCKYLMTTLLMLNISSNAIFGYVVPPCSSSSKVSYFYSVLLIKAS